MHNVRRVPTSGVSQSVLENRKEQEKQQLAIYKDLENTFLEKRRQNEFTTGALESTTALLTLNPEYYSAWNFRREVLQHLFRQADENEQDSVRMQLLAEDITMTQQSMRTHPKVYWLWNHRRWCLHALPNPDNSLESGQKKWRKELALVDMMLDMDPRNFMGWNYRRFVIAELAAAMVPGQSTPFPVFLSKDSLKSEEKQNALQLAQDELQYTLRKIESNFSNFSAWHYRSKLLPRVWDAKQLSESDRGKERDQGRLKTYAEFELLQQAMYTDPNDQRCLQSLVEYKRRLLSLANPSLEKNKREELAKEMDSHLSRLINTDPLRRSRYEELRQSYMTLIDGSEAK
ncbi:protein geranylgeranyltransferase type II [Malassezia yamatoensis]|uniref:Geranylgeranyl transferase type-2 subunit alpha n=1 Tax=Malassezia yamatoensis TaxID=253288 RepID=A0AAJ5YUZ4_9BASI|nr:protein geranylgeranyltransferase type II [Malassezia yamatoensis]